MEEVNDILRAQMDELQIEYRIGAGGYVFFKDLNVELHYKNGAILHYLDLRRLNAKFSIENDEIFVEIDGVAFNIQTLEELFILHELFKKGVYNLLFPKKSIVIDVGMNVGFASLFFARQKEVVKIYGFEPFKETFEQAEFNFQLNGNLSGKISRQNIGVGSSARKITVDYVPELKGRMSTTSDSATYIDLPSKKSVAVEIVDVAEALRNIIERHAAEQRIMKLDCEGAEYEIIHRLSETGLLKKFHSVLLEWHFKGPVIIEDTLRSAGFNVLSFDSKNNYMAMIYAFRTVPL